MSQTRIFLSSTCYDLRAVREHLREKIHEFGHELLASEYPSFPVSPDLSTIENCKKVVRDHADLLILIVGGRRGSLEPHTSRSVVNAEYLEAKSRGIDSFVFVDRQVMDLLPVYQKNPAADFTPTVDHPEVFKFVEELKSESRWIYSFSRTEDIINVLRTQLSIYLKTLIERGRVGSLIVPREFAGESRAAISLIQERPAFWEHLLSCEFLDSAIKSGQDRLSLLQNGVIFQRAEVLSSEQAFGRIQSLFTDIQRIVGAIDPALQLIPKSWGPPGITGNPVEILNAVRRVSALIDATVEWETSLRFIQAPEEFQPLFDSLHGSTVDVLGNLSRIAPGIREAIHKAKTESGYHRAEIIMTIGDPATLTRFNVELEKLKRKLGVF